jgi:sucrose-6-phosphate hydrolase SacC (GH32 family)
MANLISAVVRHFQKRLTRSQMPRELSLDHAGRLLQSPARELEGLRRDHDGARDVVVRDGPWRSNRRGNMLEIDLVVADAARAAFALELAAGSVARSGDIQTAWHPFFL